MTVQTALRESLRGYGRFAPAQTEEHFSACSLIRGSATLTQGRAEASVTPSEHGPVRWITAEREGGPTAKDDPKGALLRMARQPVGLQVVTSIDLPPARALVA